MDEPGLEACAGFLGWEGPVPAYWQVEVGVGLLVGRTVSRGVSRGDCELRKSLGNLYAHGWSSVTMRFAV